MREASFILPLANNEGRPVRAAHAAVERELASTFGGFSFRPITGAWREGGKLYRDKSREYIVAADWTPALKAKLRLIAEGAGRKAGQLAIYIKDASGNAEIVSL